MKMFIRMTEDGREVAVINGELCVAGDRVGTYASKLAGHLKEKAKKVWPDATHYSGKVLLTESQALDVNAAISDYTYRHLPDCLFLMALHDLIRARTIEYQWDMETLCDDEMRSSFLSAKVLDLQKLQNQYESRRNARVDLYLKARDILSDCSIADNTGRGAFAREAMDMLEAGESMESCEETIAKRYVRNDWIN
jgi:hypothetical protein